MTVQSVLDEIKEHFRVDFSTGKLVDLRSCDLDTLKRVAPSVWRAATA